ncbi:hypothetical protein AUEXF2481DRAFT_9335 [Aureobasidium subglaciale EXF-2481]|uniref:Uncharacterized protein n=1 Tax=Aureobasidium subglaciale (strain EXF-2481) TaxID=1043005 RepID=A0A074Y8J1_AURSE|nr:uncharacterized protein AUEXF2481DRAFT_9335 [Aureobasidium subglaciale EXF-2481]KEQ90532.1 hypothetical protein AUEXF2481DRAFT_9335 [Aureobasidium subglaciale EXF-2481]
MASVKASLDDVVQSCKGTASSYASEKFEDVKAVRGDLKEALCKLSGSEELVDCVRKPASKLSNAYEMVGSVVTSPFGSKQTGSSRASPAPTAEAGTRQYAQSTTSSHAEVVVHDFVISLVYDLSSTVESKYASAQSKLSSVKPRMSSIGSTIRSNAHSIMDQLISPDKHETSSDTASPMPSLAGSSMYEAIESVSSLKDLELQYDLAFAKTAFNSVNIFYWNVYLKRSEEEREQGLRLNRLRAALSQIRASCHAFDEMKVLAERGHDSFVTAKHYIDNHEAMVKSDPVSGPTFLREQLEVIKNELKSSDRALGERKRLKEQIRRNAWTQNENATDVVAPWVIKELQL